RKEVKRKPSVLWECSTFQPRKSLETRLASAAFVALQRSRLGLGENCRLPGFLSSLPSVRYSWSAATCRNSRHLRNSNERYYSQGAKRCQETSPDFPQEFN